jgi:hypothetical protein
MAKFRKKPVVVEAQRFDGTQASAEALRKWCGGSWMMVGGIKSFSQRRRIIDVPTLEGTMRANPGDWIIQGVNGEFYPCKPDIFAATYEPV